jgi:hypothetical protein
MADLGSGNQGVIQEADELIIAIEGTQSPERLEELARLLVDPTRAWTDWQGVGEAIAGRIQPQRKPLVVASFARVLAHSPAVLDGQPWRPRFIRFLTYGLAEPFSINHRAQGFEQADTIAKGVLAAEESLRILLDQDYSLTALTHLRRGLMKATNSAAGKAIIRPFLSEALLGIRLAALFEAADAYATSTGPLKVDGHAEIKTMVRQFCEDARRFSTHYCTSILIRVADIVETAVDADFGDSKFSKPAELRARELRKKYPLSILGQEFTLVIDVDNSGQGPAQAAEFIFETSDNIVLSRPSVYVGEVDSSVRIEVPGHVVDPSDSALISGQLCWDNADRSRGTAPVELELESQKADIPWAELAEREPYSLEPVSGEDELVGRSEMLSRLFSEARHQDVGSFFLYGQKRVGKTSIARTLAARLRASLVNYAVVSIEVGDYVSPDGSATVVNLGRRICVEVRDSFPRLLAVPIPEFTDALAPLADFLADAVKVEPGIRVLFILDEFDGLPLDLYRRGPMGNSFFLTLRSISGRPNFGFGLVGGEKMELILSAQGEALNKFQALRVDYFDRQHHWADFSDLVRRPTAGWLEFTEAALQKLYDATAGNPYFTKLLCRALYRGAVRRHDGFITEVEVDTVVQTQVRNLASNSFQHFWEDGILDIPARVEQVSIDRRRLLLALAKVLRSGRDQSMLMTKNDTTSLAREAAELGLTPSAVDTLVADFVRRSVLCDEGGALRCVVSLFEAWLVARGTHEILTVFMDPEGAARLRHNDQIGMVNSTEVVGLIEKWGTYKGQRIGEDRVRAWLDQFQHLDERRLMLRVLQGLDFYGPDLIRDRMRQADGIVRRDMYPKPAPHQKMHHDLVVSYLGSPGKSGTTYARLYADENRVSADHVVERDRIGDFLFTHDDVRAVAFVDDFLGTGTQASEYLTLLGEGRAGAWPTRPVSIYYVAVAGLQSAAQVVEESVEGLQLDLRVHVCDPIGDQDRLFTKCSRILPDPSERSEVEAVAKLYGMRLWPQAPLGYGGLGLAVVFDQSIPNNSLPVLWQSAPGWRPLFPRH